MTWCAFKLYPVLIYFKPLQQHFKKGEFMVSFSFTLATVLLMIIIIIIIIM